MRGLVALVASVLAGLAAVVASLTTRCVGKRAAIHG
jgi:hypothetical protein